MAAGVGRSLIRSAVPAAVLDHAARTASRTHFLQSLYREKGIPAPPLTALRAEVALANVLADVPDDILEEILPDPDAVAAAKARVAKAALAEAQYPAWNQAYSEILSKPTPPFPNCLSPAVKALHVMIDARDASAAADGWKNLARLIHGWAQAEDQPVYPWTTPDAESDLCSTWLWETAESLVRHALYVRLPQLARGVLSSLSDAFTQTSRKHAGQWREAPHRRASEIALLALNEGALEVVLGVMDLYENAIVTGIGEPSPDVFRQGCLGLGYLGELTCGRPRSPESLLAVNNEGSFANPADVGHLISKRLQQAAYDFHGAEWPFHPAPLVDAVSVSFEKSIVSGDGERYETSLELVHSMVELLAAAIEHGDPEDLGYICHQLGDMAKDLAEISSANAYIDSAWRSLTYAVIHTLVEGEDLDQGILSPKRVIIDYVARRLPAKNRDDLGEVAWRNFLQHGTPKLKAVRATLELELGPLGGWYV